MGLGRGGGRAGPGREEGAHLSPASPQEAVGTECWWGEVSWGPTTSFPTYSLVNYFDLTLPPFHHLYNEDNKMIYFRRSMRENRVKDSARTQQ